MVAICNLWYRDCIWQKMKKKWGEYMDTKVVTICGSMKYAKEMMTIASDLEKRYGWCVIQCVYDIDKDTITQSEMENIVNAHWKKIDISDAIYVVNIGGYIGSATKGEIEYAISHGKEVMYHEKI